MSIYRTSWIEASLAISKFWMGFFWFGQHEGMMGRQQRVPRSPEDTGKTPMDGRGMPKDCGKGDK
jgi:hypothetical protein